MWVRSTVWAPESRGRHTQRARPARNRRTHAPPSSVRETARRSSAAHRSSVRAPHYLFAGYPTPFFCASSHLLAGAKAGAPQGLLRRQSRLHVELNRPTSSKECPSASRLAARARACPATHLSALRKLPLHKFIEVCICGVARVELCMLLGRRHVELPRTAYHTHLRGVRIYMGSWRGGGARVVR